MHQFKAGDRVMHKIGREGVVDRKDETESGYVHVRFDGDRGHTLGCYAKNLTLLPAPEVAARPADPATGHPEYLKLLDEMRGLHCRKAADYGRGADPFANVRAGAEFGVPAWVGTMIRAGDKMHRIKSFVANGELKNEPVEDSLKDLAAYALIALVLFREEQAMKGGAA